MAPKAHMNKVKFEVRRNALHFQEFTAAQIAKATDLNPESIRTELNRMKNEGLLIVELSKRAPGKRGGRTALYKLTPNPEKRLALSRQVTSFYPAPVQPTPQQPTSHHYLIAKRLLDRVASRRYRDTQECEKLIADAQSHLDFAWEDEGRPEDVIGDYIHFERARLMFWCGNHETAESLFSQIRPAFMASKLGNEIALIDEYLACIRVRQHLAQQPTFTPQGLANAALGALTRIELGLLNEHPLTSLLIGLLGNLASSTRNEVLAAAQEQTSQVLEQMKELAHQEPRETVFLVTPQPHSLVDRALPFFVADTPVTNSAQLNPRERRHSVWPETNKHQTGEHTPHD